jgi:hypothetical protein
MEQIENYKIIPIGRSKNYLNQTIGDFKVLYRTNCPEGKNENHAYWLCQCNNCNKYFVKKATILSKGICECECKNDLTNKRFGRWTVLYKTEKRTKNRKIIWHCKCDCGNEKDVDSEVLRKGESKSCGCLQKEKASERSRKKRIDLTGQRFGKLIALYPIYSGECDIHTKWHCKCDCGNECEIDLGNLRSGKSQSCGCTISKQEENIIKILYKENIKFTYQIIFSNLSNKRFDFYIENNDKNYIIEFDGSQHFKYTNSGWDTREHFEKIRKNDLIKNKYCFDNNIPIIRIPYDVNYTIDDLKLETTRFLLTPENEEEYYKSRIKGE